MLRSWFMPAFCLLLPLAAGGCILPFPHAKQTSGPICGELIDPETEEPLAGACVVAAYADGGQARTTSDAQGRFYFSEKRRWHWGVMLGLGPAGGPESMSLPIDWGWAGVREVWITAPGRATLVLIPKFGGEGSGEQEPGRSNSAGDSEIRRGLLPGRTGLLGFLDTEDTDPIALGRVPVPAGGNREADSSSTGPGEQDGAQPDQQLGEGDGEAETD
jgi:hypothetical protein